MKKLLKGNVHTFAAVLLVIGAIFSVPAFFLYQNVEKIVLKETNKKAGTVAVSISKFIEQDIDEYEKASTPSPKTYLAITTWITTKKCPNSSEISKKSRRQNSSTRKD